jgi:hypothetical protein
MLNRIKLIYKRWVKFGKKVAAFQIKVIFTLAYFILIVPFGLILKIFCAFNKIGWQKVEQEETTLESASRQF